MNKEEIQLFDVLPLMPVRDIVMFPNMIVPFFVGREDSMKAIDLAVRNTKRLVVLASQKDVNVEKPGPDDIYPIATIGLIIKTKSVPDGRVKILTQGVHKVRIKEFVSTNPYQCTYEIVDDKPVELKPDDKALVGVVRENFDNLVQIGKVAYPEAAAILEDTDDPGKLADLISANLSNLKMSDSYAILSELDPVKRLDKVNKILLAEVEIHKLQQKIKANTKEEVTKTQREYFLREQLQSIKKELGENEDRDGYMKKIKEAKMPPEAEKEAIKQSKRLDTLSPESSESAIIKHYLDWMVELPWSIETKDNLDIKDARKILEEDHFGLEDVKERILEFLSVKKLHKDSKGPILCLVGPPGVGKTSICRSIAKSMGRKYVRQSLGGVRDEAEIRGHRRTYIGAMPGKIVHGLKQAGANNPVFVFDEIDKLGKDFRGDPSSALLEVLDPEQNAEFKDHYINVSTDLSKVFFIATANTAETIPGPLLDRMEVIKVSGYTELEKLEIAERYLIPKQQEENGLKKFKVEFKRDALKNIIRGYTRENGLRNLERLIGKVFRKVALKAAEGTVSEKASLVIGANNVKEYLGVLKYTDDSMRLTNATGVVTGLAWTSVGGETLELEAIKVPDKDFSLKVTGQLGTVMKESSDISFSVVKSMAKEFKIDLEEFKNTSVHIHALEGAVPKDGPSAGVTMATAIVSLLSNRPVRREVAMTGELSLTGRVLPIGGVKEKLIAAARHGSKIVIIPKDNVKDLEEVPKEILSLLEIRPVATLSDVIETAIVGAEKPVKAVKRKVKKSKKAK